MQTAPQSATFSTPNSDAKDIIQAQLEIMRQQLAVLGQSPTNETSGGSIPAPQKEVPEDFTSEVVEDSLTEIPVAAKSKQSGPMTKIYSEGFLSSAKQTKAFQDFRQSYVALTATSKEQTDRHRSYHADPRTVAGFRKDLKEIIYPIHCDKASGAYLWDLDGNRFVDLSCGYGSMYFGHNHPEVRKAIQGQLQKGLRDWASNSPCRSISETIG